MRNHRIVCFYGEQVSRAVLDEGRQKDLKELTKTRKGKIRKMEKNHEKTQEKAREAKEHKHHHHHDKKKLITNDKGHKSKQGEDSQSKDHQD